MIYLKCSKGRSYNQDYYIRQGFIQIRWRNQKLYRQAKATRIQQHQTSSTTNAKGPSLSGKHKKKRTYKNKPRTIKKTVIGTYISIITLNVKGLNAPTKRHRLTE